MFLSRWLHRLGQQGRRARRISSTSRRFRPTLEALETRELPTVSSFWGPPLPPVSALLREMSATPFGASSDGERPLTHLQALTTAANSARPSVFVHTGE